MATRKDESRKTADAVVIGAGPGGYVAAIRLAQLGMKTVCVDKGPIGGVCLNWGCIPSKAMIHASTLVETLHEHADGMGIGVGDVSVDLDRMRGWKDGIVERLTGGIGELFKRNGVEFVAGEASFVTPNMITVSGPDGVVTLETKKTLVATGARPVTLPFLKPDGERILTSKEALDLTEVPEHLLVVGGGIVGCEIGTYMRKLGAEVTIVELADQLLTGTDPELVKVVARRMKKRGITVHLKTKITAADPTANGLRAKVETPKGDKTVEATRALVAIGFQPNSETLGLDGVGVKLDDRGHLVVDEQLRTSQPDVFAIGDVIGPPYLAHKASKEGMVAAEVMAGREVALDVAAMPAAIFTDPEVATVGLTEQQARDQGLEVKTGSFPMAANGRALSTNHSDGLVKFVADARDDTLLGVHICAYGGSDLIAEAALAIEMGATVEDIGLTVHPHPTLSETLMEAAHVVEGHAIHIFVPKEKPAGGAKEKAARVGA